MVGWDSRGSTVEKYFLSLICLGWIDNLPFLRFFYSLFRFFRCGSYDRVRRLDARRFGFRRRYVQHSRLSTFFFVQYPAATSTQHMDDYGAGVGGQ